MINKLTPQGQLYSLVKTVEYMEQRANRNGGNADLELNPSLVSDFLGAETQEERNEIKREIIKDVAAQMPATWRDRFDSWRYLAMLGNPRTHIRNIFGNAGFAPVRGVKNVVGAGLEKAVGTKERTKSVLNRFDAEDRARLAVARGEFPEVQDLILSGGKYMDDYSQINRERDVWQSANPLLNALGKPISKASDFNSRALDAGDKLFSRPAYAGALAGYLKANGITAEEYGNMLEGDTRKVQAREYAIKEAQKATYRDINAFSEAISSISRMRYSDNKFVRDVASPIVEGVLPFKKTPANILMRTLEYSPVGLGKGIYDAVKNVRKGEATAVEAIDEIASGLTGMGLLGLGMLLGHMGLAVGGASGDDKQDEFNVLQGHQNYALEIGNRSITLDWLAPEALPFFVGVEFQKFLSEAKSGEATADELLEALGHIAEPMMEMSMLQGLNDLFNTLGSDYPLSSAAWTAATSYLTQFLPTILGQIERTGETVRETTFVDPNSDVPKGLQYLLGNVGNKIPGFEYNQVDYVDAWGRKEETGTVLTRALNNLLNPAYVSEIQTGSTEAELQRLYDAGYDSVLPSSFKKNVEINGEKVSGQQWVNMQTERGQTAKTVLDSFIGTEQYKAMSDDEKAKFVKKVLEYASDSGKVKGGADADDTFSRWQEAAKAAKDAVGLSEAEVIAASAYQSVLGEDAGDEIKAGIKQGMYEQWVDGRTDLTDEQKTYIKDNIKFWQMIPADSGSYFKYVDAGYSDPEEIASLMELKKTFDSNGNQSYTQEELTKGIKAHTDDPEEQQKLFNAMKQSNWKKTWSQLSRMY